MRKIDHACSRALTLVLAIVAVAAGGDVPGRPSLELVQLGLRHFEPRRRRGVGGTTRGTDAQDRVGVVRHRDDGPVAGRRGPVPLVLTVGRVGVVTVRRDEDAALGLLGRQAGRVVDDGPAVGHAAGVDPEDALGVLGDCFSRSHWNWKKKVEGLDFARDGFIQVSPGGHLKPLGASLRPK